MECAKMKVSLIFLILLVLSIFFFKFLGKFYFSGQKQKLIIFYSPFLVGYQFKEILLETWL